MEPQSLLQSVLVIAREVGEQILEIYQKGNYEQSLKADLTPVTTADMRAHQMLLEALSTLTPDIPILSEEDADIPLSVRQNWSSYWLIDPLDGTQEFILGTGEFATSIALIKDHQPIMGVVYYPLKDKLYFGQKNQGAWQQLSCGETKALSVIKHADNDKSLSITISNRQNKEQTRKRISKDWQCEFIHLGSACLKSCLVAEGGADCYLRLGLTCEWDTAAIQCILQEAGGGICDLNWQPLSYNQRETLNNPDFIVMGDTALPWQEIVL